MNPENLNQELLKLAHEQPPASQLLFVITAKNLSCTRLNRSEEVSVFPALSQDMIDYLNTTLSTHNLRAIQALVSRSIVVWLIDHANERRTSGLTLERALEQPPIEAMWACLEKMDSGLGGQSVSV